MKHCVTHARWGVRAGVRAPKNRVIFKALKTFTPRDENRSRKKLFFRFAILRPDAPAYSIESA